MDLRAWLVLVALAIVGIAGGIGAWLIARNDYPGYPGPPLNTDPPPPPPRPPRVMD